MHSMMYTRTRNSVDRSKLWQRLISLFLIGLCVAMVALGVLVLMKNRAAEDFAEWFIASYMILFGVILFCYELLWWCSVGALNRAIRKNFGKFTIAILSYDLLLGSPF
jgi:uncharacterized membrane protein YidH (DUF202 family)